MDIKLNLSYYARIILDAYKDLLCSKLCWHNKQHGHCVAIIISVRVKQYIYTRIASYTHFTQPGLLLRVLIYIMQKIKNMLLFIRLIKIITSTIYLPAASCDAITNFVVATVM